jgi:hypothetical protein
MSQMASKYKINYIKNKIYIKFMHFKAIAYLGIQIIYLGYYANRIAHAYTHINTSSEIILSNHKLESHISKYKTYI